MDIRQFNARAAGARVESRWLRWVALGLVAANVVLAIAVFSTRTVVTIQPPGLNEAARITINEANGAYKRAWGVFLAQLLGNVKPGSAEFILATISPLLSADLYRPVVNAIHEQADKIRQDRVSVSFTPREVNYDPDADIVYVTGRQVSAGPGSDPVTAQRTYEFTITIQHYQPQVTRLAVYSGAAKTKEHR